MNAQVSIPQLQPKYRGLQADKARYAAAVPSINLLPTRQSTEDTIDTAFEAQNLEALRWAILEHLGKNPELAERVADDVSRKLPWHQVPNPLTPITNAKCSHVVNYLAKKRHQDLQRIARRENRRYVNLDSYEREPLLYNAVLPKSKTVRYGLADFLDTLSPEEREIADTCLQLGKERKGFRALVRKAKTWRPAEEPEHEEAPVGYRLRVSPPYLPRPAGWHTTPLKAQGCYKDPWKSEGRRRVSPKLNSDQMKPIPTKLYMQVMTGSE